MNKRLVPKMTTDDEAEPKTARLPEALMTALKASAAGRGVPYQRQIREAIERAVRG